MTNRSLVHSAPIFALVSILAVACTAMTQQSHAPSDREFGSLISSNANAMIEEGRQTFRYDTFGDEGFWSDALKLHQAIAGAAQEGVGPGASPKTALSVGLKVDAAVRPKELVAQIMAGKVNMDDPAITLALLKLNAVVGLKRTSNKDGSLKSVGITCALCHSTVDNSFSPGIGARLDGWPNRDLNVGAIISLAPDLSPVTGLLGVDEKTLKQVLAGWGAGKFMPWYS